VDDGWERSVGDWQADGEKFPAGMKATAERIEAKGLIPGLWLAPFISQHTSAVVREHPDWVLRTKGGKPVVAGHNPGWDGAYYALDISKPEVEEQLAALFETVVEDWGYRYLKLDFLFAGLMRGERAGGGAAFEHYERVIKRITSRTVDRKGRPVAWLGCGAPFEASFRHFPLMRIGADTKEAWDWDMLRRLGLEGRPSAMVNMQHTIGKTILDGTVFVGDPDVVFCREAGMAYGEREKELIALVDFLFASQIMFSDDTHEGMGESERAFTARVIGLYDRLAGREYGARRLARNVFSVESRDGRVRGLVNLTESAYRAPAASFPGAAIVEHASREGGGIAFEPRSISLYEA
jgi:alpha-galactosidase